MSNSQYLESPPPISTMPPGIPYIVGNEAAERFSFYGMKTILFVFMTTYLASSAGTPQHMTSTEAREAIAWFVASAYFFPVIGAVIADAVLGKYRTILLLSLVYCVGHLFMAFMDLPPPLLEATIEPKSWMIAGLLLIAVGSGGIKPCVSAHVGDQFGPQNKHLISKVFGWFYFAINFGSFFSTLLTPWTLKHYGAGWAFGIPGILMAVATLALWMGRNTFVHIPPAGWDYVKDTFTGDGLKAIAKLAPIFAFVAIFWSLFDQSASAWVDQAGNMDRILWGTEVLPSQIQALNPLLILLFIPLFSYVIYPTIDRVWPLTAMRKISVGFFVTVLAFGLSGVYEQWITDGMTPSILWQVLAYAVLTAAEVMVSITCLEFAYTQAPKHMKSFIMSLYLLSVSGGNVITALVNRFTMDEDGNSTLVGADYYWFFTGLMFVAAVLFIGVGRKYVEQTHIQGE